MAILQTDSMMLSFCRPDSNRLQVVFRRFEEVMQRDCEIDLQSIDSYASDKESSEKLSSTLIPKEILKLLDGCINSSGYHTV